MSNVTDQYLLRARLKEENQYKSLQRVLSNTIHRQGRRVKQVNIITGSLSVNELDQREILKLFKVPEGSIAGVHLVEIVTHN